MQLHKHLYNKLCEGLIILPVWFDLLELIHWHKYLCDSLGEFMETFYGMSISCVF